MKKHALIYSPDIAARTPPCGQLTFESPLEGKWFKDPGSSHFFYGSYLCRLRRLSHHAACSCLDHIHLSSHFFYEPDLCRLRRLSHHAARSCLENKHITFLGDSVTRYQYTSLLNFLSSSKYQNPYDGHKPQKSVTNVAHWSHDWKAFYAGVVKNLQKLLKNGKGGVHCECDKSKAFEEWEYHLNEPSIKLDFKYVYQRPSWSEAGNNAIKWSIRDVLPSLQLGPTSDTTSDAPARRAVQEEAAGGPDEILWGPAGPGGSKPKTTARRAVREEGEGGPGGQSIRGSGRAKPKAGARRAVWEEGEGGDDEKRPSQMPVQGEKQAKPMAGARQKTMGVDMQHMEKQAKPMAGTRRKTSQANGRSKEKTKPSKRPVQSNKQAKPKAGTSRAAGEEGEGGDEENKPSHPDILILNMCAWWDAGRATKGGTSASIEKMVEAMVKSTSIIFEYGALLDAAARESGWEVNDVRSLVRAAAIQNLTITWTPSSVHFIPLGYETMNDMLLNILCPSHHMGLSSPN
eukprot:gene4362-14485_t